MVRFFEAPAESICVPWKLLLARVGIKVTKRDEKIEELLRQALRAVVAKAKPRAVAKDLPCKEREGKITVGRKLISGNLAETHLRDAKEVTLFVATLGADVDALIEEAHRRGDDIFSFLADGAASELAEFWVRRVDAILRAQKEPLKGGARISPGYGDLPLSLNAWIVGETCAETIGVKVVEGSYELLPRKTITAMIGWREGEEKTL